MCLSVHVYVCFRFPAPGCYNCYSVDCYIIASISLGFPTVFLSCSPLALIFPNSEKWSHFLLCTAAQAARTGFLLWHKQNHVTRTGIERRRKGTAILEGKGVSVKALGPAECRSTSHFHLLSMLFELLFYFKACWWEILNMCTCKLVRKFVILPNSQQLRASLAWLNWSFRNTFPRVDLRSMSPDVIVICPQTGITAGNLLVLPTWQLWYICLNSQVIHKWLLSCSKHVLCGRAGAERWLPWCFHTPHSLLFGLHWWPEKGFFPPDSCGSTQGPCPIVPPAWTGSVDVPAMVPDLLRGDLLQVLTPQPLQKRLVCCSCSHGLCVLRALLFTHPSVCIGISFSSKLKP